jgi:hypothetical protein
MSKGKIVYVDVFDFGYDHEKFDGLTLEQFVDTFADLLDEVPEEFRDKAFVKFELERSCDDSWLVFKCGYERAETPEETAEREQREARKAEAERVGQEAYEREQYLRLKAKFG